jgi:hypothetical protein
MWSLSVKPSRLWILSIFQNHFFNSLEDCANYIHPLTLLYSKLFISYNMNDTQGLWSESSAGECNQYQPERYVDTVYQSQERIRRTRWASFAAVVWCVVFGILHLYWALDGTVGFAEWSMPPNKILALTRDPLYIGITWGVVIMCVFGTFVALAPFQTWAGRIPRWLLLTPLWIACGMLLVRGIGNPTQTALIIGGVMPFEPLAGPDAQAWYLWLLLDLVLFSPWFILGGFAFGATAWSARRHGDDIGGRDTVSEGQEK